MNDFIPSPEDRPCKKRQIDTSKTKINLWRDTGENKNPGDKKLYVSPPSARVKPSAMVNTNCVTCNREFTVPKGLLFNGKYTCDACILKKG